MKLIGPGRIQFSVRSLLIATAVLAFSLAPVVWVTRERRQMLRAREEAIRSVILAERRRVELRGQGARREHRRVRPGFGQRQNIPDSTSRSTDRTSAAGKR